jgi:hypothetical protein
MKMGKVLFAFLNQFLSQINHMKLVYSGKNIRFSEEKGQNEITFFKKQQVQHEQKTWSIPEE